MRRKTTTRFGVAVAALAVAVAGVPALANPGHGGHDEFGKKLRTIKKLDGPRGVDALGHGRTLVTEADGTFSLIVERRHKKARKIELGRLNTAFPPAISKGPHGSIYLLNGATGGPPEEKMMRFLRSSAKAPAAGATLFKWRPGWKKPRAVADIGAYQQKDPDPFDQEGFPEDSNPFGLQALKDGTVLVADAAGNDLLRVWPKKGKIRTVARLKPRKVETPEGLPPPPDFPPAGTPFVAEAVATSVTVGRDGYWYVGELRGFPATPGTSQIWRIKPGTTNATCRPNRPFVGPCKRFVDGLTSVTDLAAGKRGIYALELSKMSWLHMELGIPGSEVGGLFVIKRRGESPRKREIVKNQLIMPGGVDVSDQIYVVGPLFGPGALMKVN